MSYRLVLSSSRGSRLALASRPHRHERIRLARESQRTQSRLVISPPDPFEVHVWALSMTQTRRARRSHCGQHAHSARGGLRSGPRATPLDVNRRATVRLAQATPRERRCQRRRWRHPVVEPKPGPERCGASSSADYTPAIWIAPPIVSGLQRGGGRLRRRLGAIGTTAGSPHLVAPSLAAWETIGVLVGIEPRARAASAESLAAHWTPDAVRGARARRLKARRSVERLGVRSGHLLAGTRLGGWV